MAPLPWRTLRIEGRAKKVKGTNAHTECSSGKAHGQNNFNGIHVLIPLTPRRSSSVQAPFSSPAGKSGLDMPMPDNLREPLTCVCVCKCVCLCLCVCVCADSRHHEGGLWISPLTVVQIFAPCSYFDNVCTKSGLASHVAQYPTDVCMISELKQIN